MSWTPQAAFQKLPFKLQRFFTRYPPSPFKTYAEETTSTLAEDANPFLYNRHPVTKKVHDPIYSMRRQSDLYKLAFKYGVADLLPNLNGNKKFFTEKYESKPALRGVLRPKGHKWERTMDQRKQKIKDAVANADDLIIAARGNKYKRRLEKRKEEKITWV